MRASQMRQLLVNTQINLQVLAGNSACNPPSVYDTFAILLKMKITPFSLLCKKGKETKL